MKLTTKSIYAILALVYIARHQGGGFVRVEDISHVYDISQKYLNQLLGGLKGVQYLTAKRGVGGGYRLGKAAEEISLAEIIRLMDGALAPVESVSLYHYGQTPLEKEPKVVRVFKEIRDYVAEKLENITLADLV